jgi:hypothetical protein
MAKAAWALAEDQHWVITRRQLLEIGYTPEAIDYRIEVRRLRPLHEGVFMVWRSDVDREGYFLGAVLACGESAALSHDSGGELWRSARGSQVRSTYPCCEVIHVGQASRSIAG